MGRSPRMPCLLGALACAAHCLTHPPPFIRVRTGGRAAQSGGQRESRDARPRPRQRRARSAAEDAYARACVGHLRGGEGLACCTLARRSEGPPAPHAGLSCLRGRLFLIPSSIPSSCMLLIAPLWPTAQPPKPPPRRPARSAYCLIRTAPAQGLTQVASCLVGHRACPPPPPHSFRPACTHPSCRQPSPRSSVQRLPPPPLAKRHWPQRLSE
jgi:hypothetical protein